MIPIWPASLPQRLDRDGAEYSLRDARVMPSSGDGAPLLPVRRRYSSAARPWSGSLTLTDTQRVRLERWWDDETAGGVIPFWFPAIARHGDPVTLNGAPLTSGGEVLTMSAWTLMMFGPQPPRIMPLGGPWWRAAITLWELP